MSSKASARANRLSSHVLANVEPPVLQVTSTAGADGAMDDIDVDRVSYGFMASQALFAGLALGVFDHIAAKKGAETTIEELKQATGVNAPRLQTLVTALVALKALRRGSAGYTLSNNAAMYLVRSSKYFYGDYIRMQVGSQFYRLMTDLPDIVKTGKAPDYQQLFSDPSEAETYTTAQHNGSLATAKQLLRKVNLEGAKSMLDIGGGSGAFSIVTARKVNGIKATVLEFPEVCKTGRRFVAAEPADVAARINYVEGSCLDAWPEALGTNHDVVLISYVSESVPAEAVPEMYRRSFERLKSGGLLIVHSFMVDDSLDGPELGALWSLQHVAVNAGGMGLHPKKVSSLMKQVGFTDIWHNDMIGGMTKLVVGKKP